MEQKKQNTQSEEKKTYNLQIKIPIEFKKKFENLGKEMGVSMNQYLLYVMMKEVKNSKII